LQAHTDLYQFLPKLTNQNSATIAALPEGTYLQLQGTFLQFHRAYKGVLFYSDENDTAVKRVIVPGEGLFFIVSF
jgi:hypothetical protein